MQESTSFTEYSEYTNSFIVTLYNLFTLQGTYYTSSISVSDEFSRTRHIHFVRLNNIHRINTKSIISTQEYIYEVLTKKYYFEMVIEYNVRQIWSADHFADVTSDFYKNLNQQIHSLHCSFKCSK